MWMNRYEIDAAFERHVGDPILEPVVTLLRDYRDEVDRKSDGWAHWSAGSNAAAPLMDMLQGKRSVQGLPQAQARLRRFCTTHGLAYPDAHARLEYERKNALRLAIELELSTRTLRALEAAALPSELAFTFLAEAS